MVSLSAILKHIRHSTDILPYFLMPGLLAIFAALVLDYILRTIQISDWGFFGSAVSSMAAYQQILSWVSFALMAMSAIYARARRGQQRLVSLPLYLSGFIAFFLLLAPDIHESIETALWLVVFAFGLVSITAWFMQRNADVGMRPASLSAPFGKLALTSLAAVFLLMVSGAVASLTEASQACSGWPFCSGWLPSTGLGWLAFAHRLLALATAFVMVALFLRAWRSQRSQQAILSAATGALAFFVGQILTGAVMALRPNSIDLAWLHAVSVIAFWGSMVILVAATAVAARTAAEEAAEAMEPLRFGRRLKDFVILSKPIIVLLLLVTTYAGMVVGGKGIPSFVLTFWTMLGGALAAGGSSAINQFIDRDIDRRMQRTAKRPLPDGRLWPAEGLAYGIGAVVLAFYLMAAFVNLLAALLSLAGAVYYVLLYSIWLKRLTVQNIVIGGGAGAIPPLVGWAAASGSLNIPALFLFAIIFLWTPPHFWALALVRRRDYARAGVPMLPVVQGEKAARKQIFIYTLELVALTLLMPVLKITGSFFLISAIVLGAWLIFTAWKVLRGGGNKYAWQMYRHSSMYLAFLFLALVVDVLV
jgi:protoheme IX farnesyltransferase